MIDRINEDFKAKLLQSVQPKRLVIESQLPAEFMEQARELKGIIREFEVSVKDSLNEIVKIIEKQEDSAKLDIDSISRPQIKKDGIVVECVLIYTDETYDSQAEYGIDYLLTLDGSYTVRVESNTGVYKGNADPNKIAKEILEHFLS